LLSGFSNVSGDLISAETHLLRDADLTLFSARGLLDRYAAETRKPLLVRNAVTAADFERAGPPSDLAVAGYVGALDSWFDIEAVREAALQNQECRFLLAGRVDSPPVRQLDDLPNVELVGEIPYPLVPEFMARFRIALIPFRLEPLTLMTNPIKLYEYFSAGLPVVSTRLPEVELYEKLVYFADTPAQFSSRLSEALQEKSPELKKERIATASRETWLTRANAFMETISTVRCARNRELLDEPLNCSTVPLLNKQAVRT
jgi:glycosyltransferase involved in cell wall biosynthesis